MRKANGGGLQHVQRRGEGYCCYAYSRTHALERMPHQNP